MPASTLVSDSRGTGLCQPLTALAMAVDIHAILPGNNSPWYWHKPHISAAAEVLCQTGSGGFAGVWWWDMAGSTALMFLAGECRECWQGRGGRGMFPTVWLQVLPQEPARLWHWATELGEKDGGGHKAEPQALKRTLLKIPTHCFTRTGEILLDKVCFPKSWSPGKASSTRARAGGVCKEAGLGIRCITETVRMQSLCQ